MRRFLLAILALSLATLSLTACRKNQITVVETSYMVTHPSAHKGDIIIFKNLTAAQGEPSYVHFYPGISPCAEGIITTANGQIAKCTVIADPPTEARYLYYIDSNKDIKADLRTGHCPPCCPGCQIYISKSGFQETPAVHIVETPSLYPAIEILIDRNDTGYPIGATAYPKGGQPLTWIKAAPESGGWSVKFDEDVCMEPQPIVSTKGETTYCTLKPKASLGNHSYHITVDTKTGPASQIYVVPDPAVSDPQ